MKNRTKYLLCFALTLILLVLTSCSMFWSSNHAYSGGQMLDDELMSSMRAEVLGEKTETSDQKEIDDATVVETNPNKSEKETESNKSEKETESNKSEKESESSKYDDATESSKHEEQSSTEHDHEKADGSVYWTKKGGVYHLYRDCGYIKSSSEVVSGTVEEALEEGKSGACSRCQSRKDKE